jgi:hypothetical protein
VRLDARLTADGLHVGRGVAQEERAALSEQ